MAISPGCSPANSIICSEFVAYFLRIAELVALQGSRGQSRHGLRRSIEGEAAIQPPGLQQREEDVE